MRIGQTKRDSIIEAVLNIIIGYVVAIAAQKIIFPLFDIHISTADNCKVACLFTLVSLARSYLLRRLFNRWHIYKALKEIS